MAITVNRATLARQVDGVIEYIYPKTYADLVEYDSTQNVKEKIDSIATNIEDKVDKPIDGNNATYNGSPGQVLETNGDGTTSWVSRARVYVGSGEMPEGYDVQIDPEATAIEIDTTLTKSGAIAEAKAVGDAIKNIQNTITQLHADAQAEATALDDLEDEFLNGIKDYIYFRDTVTKYIYTVRVENGVLTCSARCVSIAVSTNPLKTEYVDGELFNPTGMVVTATCEDGKTRVVNGYTYSSEPLTDETTSIRIYYVENGTTYSTDLPINVSNDCTGITVTTYPTKTEYNVGDTFDPTGMVVTAIYQNGTIKPITNYTYTTEAITSDTKSITISYVENGKTYTETISITVLVKCTGITITTKPTKTQYFIGETFNPAGMVVTANYNNGTSKAVTNYTYPTVGLVAGANSITISYVENGTTFMETVDITVVAKCTGISVTTKPTKTQYTEGEKFNPAGMVVTASYNNGTTKAVTGYTYPTNALTVGLTSAAISYTENGITVATTVAITVATAFDTNILKDFTYETNSDGTYTITGWKGTKNGVASTECVVPDNKYIIVNPL